MKPEGKERIRMVESLSNGFFLWREVYGVKKLSYGGRGIILPQENYPTTFLMMRALTFLHSPCFLLFYCVEVAYELGRQVVDVFSD